MPRDDGDATVALAAATVALGHALQENNGNLSDGALAWLTGTLLLVGFAVLGPKGLPGERTRSQLLLRAVFAVGLFWQFWELATHLPGIYLRLHNQQQFFTYLGLLCVAAVVAGAGLATRGGLGHLQLPLLVGLHLALGVWLLQTSPDPFIDVFTMHRDSYQALLHGQNPYGITFQNIYGDDRFYGEGVVQNGRVMFGFLYPPLSLLLGLPGQLLFGDYRYMNLFAMDAAVVLWWRARPSWVSASSAALFLFTPRGLFVLEQGWTEPLAVLACAGVLWTLSRRPRWAPYAFGLLIFVKQYLVLAFPFVGWLAPKERRWRAYAIAAAVAGVIVLPFFLWSPRAMFHSAVELHLKQPFRMEALSYLAWYAGKTGTRLSPAVGFVVAAGAIALAWWRGTRTASGFGAALAFVLAVFFAFNKQAACNYDYGIIGMLAGAVAVARTEGMDGSDA